MTLTSWRENVENLIARRVSDALAPLPRAQFATVDAVGATVTLRLDSSPWVVIDCSPPTLTAVEAGDRVLVLSWAARRVIVGKVSPATAPTPVAPIWATTSFFNSWVNFGSGSAPAGYMIDGENGYLRGLIKDGAMGSKIMVLPTDARPQYRNMATCWSSTGPVRVDVWPGGDVILAAAGDTTFVTGHSLSLDNIVYRRA